MKNLKIVFQTVIAVLLLLQTSSAQEAAPTAKELSSQLNALVLDNASTVRLKLEFVPTAGGDKIVLQLQANARRTAASSDILYRVLWPKERKGEGFLLQKRANQAPTGTVFTPPDSLKPLSASQMREGIFGSALSYEDLVGNFFAWPSQEIVGTEVVNRVPCQILESKPGNGDHSSYTSVKSWIDTKRMIPLRVEKYGSGGKLVSRIVTTYVAKDDKNRAIPANLSIQRGGQETVIEGSNSKHDVTFPDTSFSAEAFKAE